MLIECILHIIQALVCKCIKCSNWHSQENVYDKTEPKNIMMPETCNYAFVVGTGWLYGCSSCHRFTCLVVILLYLLQSVGE